MKTLFFELNEFSLSVLEEGAKKLKLPSIEKLLQFHKSQTLTDDTYESDYLEPWVQWVNVHTGKPSSIHQIKHLGDVPSLDFPQIWEDLSEKGVTTGVWGLMNAGRAGAKNCLFFLPDPWSFSETAHPQKLDQLLLPLRYTSKNYGEKQWKKLILEMGGLIRFFKEEKLFGFLIKKIPNLFKNLIQHRAKPFVFISLLDELSLKLFLRYQNRFSPQVSFLFLNSIAHLQHHQWKGGITKTSPLGLGLLAIDQIVQDLFQVYDLEKDLIIVANALTQTSTENDPPWILYRQKDHERFLKAIGIHEVKVEPHMTHDAHLFFKSAEKAKEGFDILKHVSIGKEPLFQIESYLKEPNKLFYKIIYTKPVSKMQKFTVQNRSFSFFDYFVQIVQRTGKHIQRGDILCNQKIFPEKLKNEEIKEHLEKFLEGKQINLSASSLPNETYKNGSFL